MKRAEHIEQVASRLLSRPDFQEAVVAIRQSMGMPKLGFDSEETAEKWKEENIYMKFDAWKPVEDAIVTWIQKYPGLSSDWKDGLKRYILLNDPEDMWLPTEISVGAARDELTGNWKIVMYIPLDATQKEIKDSLPQVEEWKRKIKGGKKLRRQPSPYMDKAIEALRIYKEVGSYQKTADKMTTLYGDRFDKERVRNLIRNFKNQAGIN